MTTRTRPAELVLDARAQLGEGPLWDAARRRLLWVDITAGDLHAFDPETGKDGAVAVGRALGAVGLRGGGGLVLAVADGFATADGDGGDVTLERQVEPHAPRTRMNDGACGPDGAFWAGTTGAPGECGLYRLDSDWTSELVVEGVSTSNGIDWSPDGQYMYYVDTPTGRVDRFRFSSSGSLSARETFVKVARGLPDGLTVDVDGCVWVALWDGGAVHRYTPDRQLDQVVTVPVDRATSCAFGGADLDVLYVTTAQPSPAAGRQPLAGGVFAHRPGTRGREPYQFAG